MATRKLRYPHAPNHYRPRPHALFLRRRSPHPPRAHCSGSTRCSRRSNGPGPACWMLALRLPYFFRKIIFGHCRTARESVKTTPLCASHWRFSLHTPADRSTLPHDCRQIRRLDLKACKSSRLTAFTSLLDTPYSVEAAQLIDQSAHLLEDVAERLPSRIPNSVGKLIGSLVLSGLSMSVPALPSCR